LLLQIAERLRGLMPEELPLFVRISATDWVESGWDIEQSVELAKQRWGERPKSAGLQKWCGMLVARALKNSQLTCGERHAISGTGH
jgi:hypothetical protein